MKLINARTFFTTSLVVIPTVVLLVYLNGRVAHRSLYLNSMISTTLLSIVLVFFLTMGLYNGWKLKDTVGRFRIRFHSPKIPDITGADSAISFPDGGDEGCIGIVAGIILWIVVAVLGVIILFFLGEIIWVAILSLAALLYWIFFRALRLIFKKSRVCRGNFLKSLGFALGYTLLYNCWIYGIILSLHFLA